MSINTDTTYDIKTASPTLAVGEGSVVLDSATGAPRQFLNPSQPQRRYLLDENVFWHSSDHQWGSGHIITRTGAARWSVPDSVDIELNASRAIHRLPIGLEVEVSRRGGLTMTERYRFTNCTSDTIELTGIGIQTPFADLYEDAAEALDRSVHAHIFTGGSWAWALAQPMSGAGPSLGLIVRKGQLWGYSVESRNRNTSSNARGHIVLQVTDAARNEKAFGGQPTIRLEPGQHYELCWELAWFDDTSAFLAATAAPAMFSALNSAVGAPIRVKTDLDVSSPNDEVTITRDGSDILINSQEVGNFTIDVGQTARTEVGFHRPLRETVQERTEYILSHQRPRERAGLLAHAFVPVDTHTLLTQPANGWSDWSDGSERIGMAMLLQRARNARWLDADSDTALSNWAEFARANLLDATGASRRGSHDTTGPRLYDSTWLGEFFLARFHQTQKPDDLELALRIILRAFELGAAGFLAINFSDTCMDLADTLTAQGQTVRAEEIRARLVASARYFLAQGHDLPAHEVAYEQSIVAPLINLFIDAYAITEAPEFLKAIAERLPWLLAFGGPQPHARLQGIAIRHWDGYWFGTRRQWGDIFPHYWSALTATVLLRLPAAIRTQAMEELAVTILRANMSNYSADGSATCAFVFPTTVDGAPAHTADPLANDQDWHLAIWMLMADRFDIPTA